MNMAEEGPLVPWRGRTDIRSGSQVDLVYLGSPEYLVEGQRHSPRWQRVPEVDIVVNDHHHDSDISHQSTRYIWYILCYICRALNLVPLTWTLLDCVLPLVNGTAAAGRSRTVCCIVRGLDMLSHRPHFAAVWRTGTVPAMQRHAMLLSGGRTWCVLSL